MVEHICRRLSLALLRHNRISQDQYVCMMELRYLESRRRDIQVQEDHRNRRRRQRASDPLTGTLFPGASSDEDEGHNGIRDQEEHLRVRVETLTNRLEESLKCAVDQETDIVNICNEMGLPTCPVYTGLGAEANREAGEVLPATVLRARLIRSVLRRSRRGPGAGHGSDLHRPIGRGSEH